MKTYQATVSVDGVQYPVYSAAEYDTKLNEWDADGIEPSNAFVTISTGEVVNIIQETKAGLVEPVYGNGYSITSFRYKEQK